MIDPIWHRQGIAAFRRGFLRSPQRNEAKNRAKIGYGLYQCECCTWIDGPKQFQIDHIKPVMEDKDWNHIVERFWDLNNLQLICLSCHKEKTQLDREKMREQRKENG